MAARKWSYSQSSRKPLSAAPLNEIECDSIEGIRLGLFFDLPSGDGRGDKAVVALETGRRAPVRLCQPNVIRSPTRESDK